MASMTKEEIYRKISEAATSGAGNNMLDGRGRMAVKSFKLGDGYNGACVIVTGVIVASQQIPVQDVVTGAQLDIKPNLINSEVGLVFMIKYVAALGDLKKLVLALFDEKAEDNPNDIFVPFLAGLCENNNAFGRVADYSTIRKVTKENKVQMVLPQWTVVQQSEADVEAMKAWITSLTVGPAKT